MILFLYEIFQNVIFLILSFLNFFFKEKKFLRFIQLRNPRFFLVQVEEASLKYLALKKENQNQLLYWFHVSSAGEMEQAIPVARELHQKTRACFFVTYYSPSSEPFLKNFPAMIGSAGLPLDQRSSYCEALKKLPVSAIFLVRYDIWPSLFCFCRKNKLPINLLSASKTKTRRGFLGVISKYWSEFFYKKVSHIFAVAPEDVSYFKKIAPESQVYLAGDAKWARAFERAKTSTKASSDSDFSAFLNFCSLKRTKARNLVFGSPHVHEHQIAQMCSQLKENVFIVYVPHDVSAEKCDEILKDLQSFGMNGILYSHFVRLHSTQKAESYNYNFIVIDKVGFLAEIYQIADAAIIGGGFDGQIHNVLEAAAHGVPVLFGPCFSRAYEAQQLVDKEAGLSFATESDLFQFLRLWVSVGNQTEDATNLAFMRLQKARQCAVEVFRNIPNTGEVVLKVLSNL